MEAVWGSGDGEKYCESGAITSAVVSDGVVNLSTVEGASDGHEVGVFQNCSKLSTVRLPESLRRIGHRAFYNCKALVHLDIPSGVNEIGVQAFYGCESLETMLIPEGVVHLPRSIFKGCLSLKCVRLPPSLRTIGSHAFEGCYSLMSLNESTSANLLTGVTQIGERAFYGCASLSSIKLPNGVTVIRESTFEDCVSLSRVELPPALKTVRAYAFHDTHPRLSIELPETVKNVFVGENTLGRRIRLPASLSVLTNGGNVRGLLCGVEEVVISCSSDIGLLADHLAALRFLNPGLRFKVLYGGGLGMSPYPKISDHLPEVAFSFDLSLRELLNLYEGGGGSGSLLHEMASSKFDDQLSLFVDIMSRHRILPESALYDILPFLWGVNFSQAILSESVSKIVRLLDAADADADGATDGAAAVQFNVNVDSQDVTCGGEERRREKVKTLGETSGKPIVVEEWCSLL